MVIGQADMYNGTANQGGSASEYTLFLPWGNPDVAQGRLYIPDLNNNRVLGYNSIPSINNAPADFVLGQPDFATTASGLTQSGMNWPLDISSDDGRLFVLDFGNSRMLVWNTVPATTNIPPDVVVGQADFVTSDTTCDDSTFFSAVGAHVSGGRLIAADTEHNRVLIWNTVPATNGAPADIVLGQPDFVSCQVNRGGATAQNSLDFPESVWSDGERLFVADTGNYRVLIWNTFPTASDTPPDVVVGQPDFVTNVPATSAYNFAWPSKLTSNGSQLFVGDTQNHRVMVWNTIPAINNSPADRVLGQPDFSTKATGLAPDAMNTPGGVLVHGKQLFVSDLNNSRVLIFNSN